MKKKCNVLITGSSKGIGAAVAKILSQEGYNIILTGRDEAGLKLLSEKYNAQYYVQDLLREGGCDDLIKNITARFGGINVLINNAGEYIWSPVEKTDEKDIERLVELNTVVPYRLIKLCVPFMKENSWGRIVNIGSISGSVGEANASLYSMTKSAFSGLSKSLALELAENGITVNTINPGWVETELAKNACIEGDFSEEENIEMIPQRRFIEPEEVANLVKYLISDEAKGLTGQSINLCAGLSVG